VTRQRILFIADRVLPVGASVIALQQMTAAVMRGFDVHLATTMASTLGGLSVADEITTHRFATLGETTRENPEPRIEANSKVIRALTERLAPDVTVVHSYGRLFDNTGIAACDSVSEVVMWLHDEYALRGFHFEYPDYQGKLYRSYEPWDPAWSNQALHIEPLLNLGRTKVVGPSRWLANQARLVLGPRVPVRHIHNGVDSSVFPAVGRVEPSQPARLICLGDPFDPRKGIVDALQALTLLDANQRSDIRDVVILGNVRTDLRTETSATDLASIRAVPFLDAFLQRHGVSREVRDLVRLTGWVRQPALVAELLAQADLCLHLSRAENLPTVCIEAQLASVDLIATDVGGTAETVASTDCLIESSADPDQRASAVVARLEDRPDSETYEQRAAWTRDRFDVNRSFDKLLDVAFTT
jgi:glycosyltransferase involved in cell wall biosynthesis